VKAACELLEEPGWAQDCGATYVGNLEGGDLMAGLADVVVCDGFTGNVTLKSLEGGFDIFKSATRQALAEAGELSSGPAADAIGKALDPLYEETFNASRTGAAMLLGTRGVTLISHGSSSAQTIANAIRTADEMAQDGIIDAIRAAVTVGDG
ncbi:MAG: hypothetical protein AAFO29_12660, partial [Actinomycetota bacterium]